MTISQDKVVAMHYTVTDPQGNELDTSVAGEPLVFLFGHGSLIPGLEQALVGKAAGDKFKADIAAAANHNAAVAALKLLQFTHYRTDMFRCGDKKHFVIGFNNSGAKWLYRMTATVYSRYPGFDIRHMLFQRR